MKIKIQTNTLNKFLTIQLSEEKCFVNGQEKIVNCQDFIERLLYIVELWEPKMINPSIIDGVHYKVSIKEDDKIFKFEGKNSFPDNFDKFINLIKELENC